MTLSIEHWMQRAKILTQVLMFSGALNIGLISTFVYFILQEKQAVVSLEVQEKQPRSIQFTNEALLRAYSQASFQDLVLRLESKELMEEGYCKRDLALSCLVAFHHFPIIKALGGEANLQKRIMGFRGQEEEERVELIAFPGLQDEQFEAILQFVRTEKWPLTTKGLFFEIQRALPPYDPSLLEAFYVTSEFHSLQRLLQKIAPSLEKAALVDVLREGSWEQMKGFCDTLRLFQCYQEEFAREVLVTYALECRSKIAASCLFQFQLDYVMKRFNDSQLILFLELNEDRKEALEPLAKELFLSPRSDVIRQKAASILYSLAQELMPQPYHYESVLNRFFPEKKVISTATFSIAPVKEVMKASAFIHVGKKSVHKVQTGESLWKIARKYGTTVDTLMKLNHLESDRLQVGKEIQIP